MESIRVEPKGLTDVGGHHGGPLLIPSIKVEPKGLTDVGGHHS